MSPTDAPSAACAALRLGAAAWVALVLAACTKPDPNVRDAGASLLDGNAPSASTPVSSASAEAPEAGVRDASSGDAAPVGMSEGCSDDMLLVAGQYCPGLEQYCLEHHEDYEKQRERRKEAEQDGEQPERSTVSERCLKYREPSECLSNRRPMRFCMDRYEWPNKKGELPLFLISWLDAKKECEAIGKRLCTEDEFNFACEGEQMLPYTYGFVRDKTKCNIDRPYRKRERSLKPYKRCMANPKCKAQIEALDQRVPSGSMTECISPFGVYDLNGNLNEWVMRPGKKYPDRSGLKGGWWGPVRGRCRPTVDFHKEEDFGYEEGFRCCKDADPAPGK